MKNVDSAKPSQAKPSQAKPLDKNVQLASSSERFVGFWYSLFTLIVPESSKLYKFLSFKWKSLTSARRRRKQRDADKLSFSIIVTDACNLNCKYCMTYSPVVKTPKMIDIVSYEKDMEQLGRLLDGEVNRVDLSGGELLLHPDIVQIIAMTRRYLPKGDLRLLTNGILLHQMGEDFWKCCHDNDFMVQITPYKQIKLNYERILGLAKSYDVRLIYFVNNPWFTEKNSFRKSPISESGNFDIRKNYKQCIYTKCQAMLGSRIYGCSKVCFIGAFNDYFGTKFEVAEGDYIDIHKVKDKKEIAEFFSKPMPFCRYCDMDRWEWGLPWEISKREVSEWT